MCGWVLLTAFVIYSEPRPNLEGFAINKFLLEIMLLAEAFEISPDFTCTIILKFLLFFQTLMWIIGLDPARFQGSLHTLTLAGDPHSFLR